MQHILEESNNGFWVLALCPSCNSKTGFRYGSAYANFVSQVSKSAGIEDLKGNVYVHLEDVYPVRVLKQMFSMFLCAMPQRSMPAWQKIRNFVLQRDANLPSDAPHVYLYKNISRVGRIAPPCGISELFTSRGPILVSEISWPPVGIIFCDPPDDRFKDMEDVTSWGQYNFKQKKNLVIKLPQLRITTDHPIAFGTPDEVERWRTTHGILWYVPEADDPTLQTSVSMLWKKAAG